jgi:hypothetical protein
MVAMMKTQDQPAPVDVRSAVAELVDSIGEPLARARLSISRQALDRLLAGRPVRRGTVASCRLGLVNVPAAPAPHAVD